MSHFRLEFDRLRNSIAHKARVTTNEADAYLNLQPLSEEADRSFQNHSASFTTEERRFINDIHIFSSNQNTLKESRDPIIPAEQKKTPAKRKQSEESEKLDKLIIKMTKKKSTTKDIVSAAQKKFPKSEINDGVIRSRKYRLRKSDKLI